MMYNVKKVHMQIDEKDLPPIESRRKFLTRGNKGGNSQNKKSKRGKRKKCILIHLVILLSIFHTFRDSI